MIAPGRIPCLNPRCRRTFRQEAEGQEVICGKCFRALPAELRNEHRRFWREYRTWSRRALRTSDALKAMRMRDIRDQWSERIHANWELIRQAVTAPERPAGLDGFLEDMGLA